MWQPREFNEDNHEVSIRVGDRYETRRRIGRGAFGVVYNGIDTDLNEMVAIKFEGLNARFPQIEYESRVYKTLSGVEGVPSARHFDNVNNALVLDLLGPSLEELFKFCDRTFSLETVLLLADQLITRIEHIHAKSYIHRDIKPENFLMGLDKRRDQVNVIDFGLSKKYRDPQTHEHVSYSENKNLTGTARFASINTHLGIERSRRDDMESIGYMLVYFSRGKLPWQGLKAVSQKEEFDLIKEVKMSTTVEALCRDLPGEFARYLEYSRSLGFEDKPDYDYLRSIFRDLLKCKGSGTITSSIRKLRKDQEGPSTLARALAQHTLSASPAAG